jgi:hypothetical protein
MAETLTTEMLEDAIEQVPAHRTNLRRDLRNTLDLVRRGIPIKSNAPVWIQAQNVIFVSKIDGELEEI